MHTIKTHYDTLKVTRDAPLEVIRGAYKGLSQKYHPDKNPGPDAASMMAVLNTAYRTLANPLTRIDHDKWIAQQESMLGQPCPGNSVDKEAAVAVPHGSRAGLRPSGQARQKKWLMAGLLGVSLLGGYGFTVLSKQPTKEYYSLESHVKNVPTSIAAVLPTNASGKAFFQQTNVEK